jgi:hypothetical protein
MPNITPIEATHQREMGVIEATSKRVPGRLESPVRHVTRLGEATKRNQAEPIAEPDAYEPTSDDLLTQLGCWVLGAIAGVCFSVVWVSL